MLILNKTLNVEIILNQLYQHPRVQAQNGANTGCGKHRVTVYVVQLQKSLTNGNQHIFMKNY